MDLTKLSITDLFIYKETISAMIEHGEEDSAVTEEALEVLYAKLDKIDDEIYGRIDTI